MVNHVLGALFCSCELFVKFLHFPRYWLHCRTEHSTSRIFFSLIKRAAISRFSCAENFAFPLWCNREALFVADPLNCLDRFRRICLRLRVSPVLSPLCNHHSCIECRCNKYVSETPYCLQVSLPTGKSAEIQRASARRGISLYMTRPHALSCERFSVESFYVFTPRSRYPRITFHTNNFRRIY